MLQKIKPYWLEAIFVIGTLLFAMSRQLNLGTVVGLTVQALVFSAIVRRYIFAVTDMRKHVAKEANAKGISTARQLGRMVRNVLLYIFVPCAIITIFLVGIAFWVGRSS